MRSSACNTWLGRLITLLVAFVVSSTLVFAQTKTVTGTVVDEMGEPVIGANVVVVGTTNGATTDMDGNFSIQNVANNATLRVSYIGYKEQNIPVAGRNKFNIALEEDRDELDEVVVIGYGTVKRRDLTGSVASVSGDKLKANPVTNVAQALQGQLPGVSVTSQDGRPGATMSIRVRGGGSITQSNEPLFIVDGVQVSSIDDIPADNIETIDVLKDAASTAIYGASGANGVILITTKGAKEGKAVVKYGVYFQSKWNPELIETQSAYEHVYNTWSYLTLYGANYGRDVAKYYGVGSANGNHINDYRNVSVHNYVEDLMRTANGWNHDLSISGGTDKTKIYVAVNYTDDEGIRINSGYNRLGANFKIDQKINKKLAVDFDLRYAKTMLTGNHYDNATSAYRYAPIDADIIERFGTNDPNLLGMGSQNVEESYNPYTATLQYDFGREIHRVRARAGISWDVIKGMRFRTELSGGRNWNESKTWDGGQVSGINSAKLEKSNGYNVRWVNTLTYDVQGLGKDHSVTLMVGNEISGSKSNSSSYYGQDYPKEFTKTDAFGQITMNDVVNAKYESSIGTPVHSTSFFGRANYGYKGRYLLTFTFRADGSSKFAPEHHWAYFPAAAAAWRISDESWMEGTKDWLDNLKLRLSYGTSGADNISSSLWKSTWTTKSIIVDGETISIYQPGSMKPNPSLMWETTYSRNLGLDFAFFNNRVRGSLDFYLNNTEDLLMQVPCDASTGYEYQYDNVGETSNKGVELTFAYDLVRSKNFNLSFSMNYNFNKNNVEKIIEGAMCDTHNGWASSMLQPYYDYIVREGEPVGTINGYKSAGYFTVDDFDYNASTGKYTLKDSQRGYATAGNYPSQLIALNAESDGTTVLPFPGAPKFVDADGDGEADQQILGHARAEHTGGFNFSGNWKAVDFAIGFTYQIGGKVYNANAMNSFKGDKDTAAGANRLYYAGKAFRYHTIDSAGDLVFDPSPEALRAINQDTEYSTMMSEYGIVSSKFIEDASYLRLNTLTLGYTLPLNWTKKVGVSNARFYVTGTNLFCLTGYSGLDPDVTTSSSSGGFPTPGYDFNSYPKARTITVGANITF
ncbi:MAG: TonB-dependent receptor [Bacteroidales bacterium]|nr:TonB-dependent receptor [Bacteroidales bacterium]